jgi:hypothetical protein
MNDLFQESKCGKQVESVLPNAIRALSVSRPTDRHKRTQLETNEDGSNAPTTVPKR